MNKRVKPIVSVMLFVFVTPAKNIFRFSIVATIAEFEFPSAFLRLLSSPTE